jgi:hypothetical protein
MSNFGRPTAYKPDYCELAHTACRHPDRSAQRGVEGT